MLYWYTAGGQCLAPARGTLSFQHAQPAIQPVIFWRTKCRLKSYGIYWFGGWKLEAFDTRGKKIRNLHLIMWKPSRIVEIYFRAFCPADTVTHVPASHSWCTNLEGSLIFSHDWGIFLKSPDSFYLRIAWWFSLIMSLSFLWRGSSSLVFLQRYWLDACVKFKAFSILIEFCIRHANCMLWLLAMHQPWFMGLPVSLLSTVILFVCHCFTTILGDASARSLNICIYNIYNNYYICAVTAVYIYRFYHCFVGKVKQFLVVQTLFSWFPHFCCLNPTFCGYNNTVCFFNPIFFFV